MSPIFSQNYIEMYNNTNRDVYVALSKWSKINDCWTSYGWYTIKPYKTKSLNLHNYTGSIYVRGRQGILKYWGSDKLFCTDPNVSDFEIRNAEGSGCPDVKKHLFDEVTIEKGKTSTITFE